VKLSQLGILTIVQVPNDECETLGVMGIGKGNQSIWTNLANATLSTTNPTLPKLGSNSDLRGGKPETTRLINQVFYYLPDYRI
jgi:hypothetical protein